MRISSENLRGKGRKPETLPLCDPMDKLTTVFRSVRTSFVGAEKEMADSTGELAFIDWLRRRTPTRGRVLIGPGDDAALVDWSSGANYIVTTDMLLEGSCFIL